MAPARLARVKEIPKCIACLQGKARKCSHNEQQGIIGHTHDKPGLGISVDQLKLVNLAYFGKPKALRPIIIINTSAFMSTMPVNFSTPSFKKAYHV